LQIIGSGGVNPIDCTECDRILDMINAPRGFDLKPYSQAEAEAKKAKRGIWSLGVKYISLKSWRKRNK
jgi:endonuclease YncB( thermonuclease family)